MRDIAAGGAVERYYKIASNGLYEKRGPFQINILNDLFALDNRCFL